MQLPSDDPTGYCRLCFTQQHLKYVFHSNRHPLANKIVECLGLWLSSDDDFPCAVCRVCSATLETFEAFRERSRDCDLALRKHRLDAVAAEESSMELPVGPMENEPFYPLQEDAIPEIVFKAPEPPTEAEGESMICDIKCEPLMVEDDTAPSSMEESDTTKVEGCKKPKALTPYICEHCNRSFTYKGYLKRHQKECRSKEPPKQKQVPAKVVQIISPKELRKQLNLYTGPVPDKSQLKGVQHHCDLCDARYYQKAALISHRATAHRKMAQSRDQLKGVERRTE